MSSVLLYESATGYALFDVIEGPDISLSTDEVIAAMSEASRFSKLVKLRAFAPFQSAEHALDNINCVSEGIISDYLRGTLEANLPAVKKGKKSTLTLGVYDHRLATSLHEQLNFSVSSSERVQELLRGVRTHYEKLLGQLQPGELSQAQLGLAHSYSRSKVKFNVHKADNMIIQAIALLDQLDKDINTFAMRVKEWYAWHFPELTRIVTDNYQYARVVTAVGDKDNAKEDLLPKLEGILGDESLARDVIDAAKTSMGQDISPIDLINIELFAGRVMQLAEYRKDLFNYLISRMRLVAPNLGALLGESVAARLIAHAGSLTNLAKYPASTVQILGAEKALFRALKTRGKTPKYGLLFHSSYIGRAKQKNKGRISRYLANKCSIASRVDCFADVSSDVFGSKLREQVEERLRFYEAGSRPRKNLDVMKLAVNEVKAMASAEGLNTPGHGAEKKKKNKKKRKSEAAEESLAEAATVVAQADETVAETSKSSKKRKTSKGEAEDVKTSTPSKTRAAKGATPPQVDADTEARTKRSKKSRDSL